MADMIDSLIPLAQNTDLCSIDISLNKIDSERSFNSLIQLLSKARHLNYLNISYLEISESRNEELVKAMVSNKDLFAWRGSTFYADNQLPQLYKK